MIISKKRKILVFLPVMPDQLHIQSTERSLAFLLNYGFEIEWLDPYLIHKDISNPDFYQQCRQWLQANLQSYDALFGFSYGGVILQQCFPVIENSHHKVVLFSTPASVTPGLSGKLKQVISLCEAGQLADALRELYYWVFPVGTDLELFCQVENQNEGIARLVSGLTRVLTTDSKSILLKTQQNYIHLIGECSRLVTQEDVYVSSPGELKIVPGAGMKMLEDNPAFCHAAILDYLA